MTKFRKISILGTLAIIVIGAVVGLMWFLNPERKIDNEIRDTIEKQKVERVKATEALYSLVAIADSVSGIKSLRTSKFEVVDMNGKSANFGISQGDGVRSEDIVEENMIIFQNLPVDENFPEIYDSEVDIITNKVVAMRRESIYIGNKKSASELEKIARQFVERVYPNFTQIESTLEFSSGGKGGVNLFFRWEDKGFALPEGLKMDILPFIQVGITSNGYIFSYNNTVQLYSNLSKKALRRICAFIKIPRTDDSSLNPEKGTVIVWFSEYEPFQNRYLILPYEPETDFEGCSDSAKDWLRSHPYNQRI